MNVEVFLCFGERNLARACCKSAWRRLPSLLYRRLPNRQRVVFRGIEQVWHPATQLTRRSAVLWQRALANALSLTRNEPGAIHIGACQSAHLAPPNIPVA